MVLSWARDDGGGVRRVVTRRLQATGVLASYAREADVRCAAVLLAKGAVQDAARNDDPPALQASIGERGARCVPTLLYG